MRRDRPTQIGGALSAIIFYTMYWPADGPSPRSSSNWFTRAFMAVCADGRGTARQLEARSLLGSGAIHSP
jgi:hypothetical protein